MDLAPGTVVDGRFRIVRKIGEGGMASVFEAENTRLGNRFALKFMSGAVQHSRTGVDRFLREASTLAQLKHPNIVQVFDVVAHNDVPVIVMELLQGESLATRIDRGWRATSQELSELAQAMLEALGYAHANGFVHRDIKPDNVFAEVHHGGRTVWRLMDFGIARSAVDHGLTNTGQFIGTRRYASPEQIQDPRGVDHRADLFSLGVTLWEAATGVVPWENVNSEFELMKAITSYPEYSLAGGGFDPRIETLVRALTSNDRNRRVPNAASALQLLAGSTGSHGVPHPPQPAHATPARPLPMQAATPWQAPTPHAHPAGAAGAYPHPSQQAPWQGYGQAPQPMAAWSGGQPAQSTAEAMLSGFWAGRIGRMGYFLRTLGWGLLLYIGAVVGVVMIDGSGGNDGLALLGTLLMVVAIVGAGGPLLQNYVRRLHDLGHGGPRVVLFILGMFVPLVGFVVGMYMLFTPGQPGPNQYGPPPAK